MNKLKIISPWIHTTDLCNLHCSYCYVNGNSTMKKDTYDKIEKFLLGIDTEKYHLRFAGGEPLLVIEEWINFAEKMAEREDTIIEILTNLTIPPTSEFLSLLKYDNVRISVSIDSIDGEKSLTCQNMNMLTILSERINKPWIMTTLTDNNLNDIEKLATYIGINKFGWCISTDYFWQGKPIMEDLVIIMSKVINILITMDYDFNNFVFNNISINQRGGCKSGKEMFSIYCNGDIYKCQTQHNKIKPIGNIKTGYKITECKKYKSCLQCIIKDFCTGWCPLYHNPENDMCKVMKSVTLKLLEVNKNA